MNAFVSDPGRPIILSLFLAISLSGCGSGEADGGAALPDAFMPILHRAMGEEKLGMHDEALASYEEALELVPHHPGANYGAAGVLIAIQDPQRAVVRMTVALENAVSPNVLHFRRQAMALVALGRMKEAVLHLEKGVEADPKFRDSYPDLCRIYFKLSELDATIATASRALALDLDPKYPFYAAQLLYYRGVALERKGKGDEAERDLREAIRLCPQYAKPHYSLGNLLARTSREDESQALLSRHTELRKIEEEIETIHNRLGNVSPQIRPFGIRRLVTLHLLLGQTRDAESLCKDLLAMEPENTGNLVWKGYLKEVLKEYRVAVSIYRKAIAKDPTLREARAKLATLYATADDESIRSLEACERVIEEAKPHGGVGAMALAEYYRARGDLDRAITTIRRAIMTVDGDIPTLRLRLTQMLEEEKGADGSGSKGGSRP
ncbi:MAG: tetratricopeptide repeat protein [Planctomycetota bacterium]|nr:tetratricopeptide repeat protein [Planctomycetota bacterium]